MMHTKRLRDCIKKAKKFCRLIHMISVSDRTLGIARKTRVRCSNPLCCGNQRKSSGLTTRERIASEELKNWEEMY